jgi:hypothetical protein
MATAPRDMVHRFIGATNRRELEELTSLFTPDAVLDAGPRFEHPFAGRAAIRALFEGYYFRMPEMMLVARNLFVNGHQVLAEFDLFATLEGVDPGLVDLEGWEHGRRLSWSGAYIFTFNEEALITHIQIFGDERTVRWLPDSQLHERPGGKAGPSPGQTF